MTKRPVSLYIQTSLISSSSLLLIAITLAIAGRLRHSDATFLLAEHLVNPEPNLDLSLPFSRLTMDDTTATEHSNNSRVIGTEEQANGTNNDSVGAVTDRALANNVGGATTGNNHGAGGDTGVDAANQDNNNTDLRVIPGAGGAGTQFTNIATNTVAGPSRTTAGPVIATNTLGAAIPDSTIALPVVTKPGAAPSTPPMPNTSNPYNTASAISDSLAIINARVEAAMEANRDSKRARLLALRQEQEQLNKELEELDVGLGVRVSNPEPNHTHAHVSPNTNTHAHFAKALNKPDSWKDEVQGTRRADVWLKQIEVYAKAHGVEPATILPSYLGPAIGTLYDDYVQNWARQNKEPSWPEVCVAFKSIVGQRSDLEKAKVTDDFIMGRVKQATNQSVLSYKVKLQHKLLLVSDVPNHLAVRWFVSGLGCKFLRAECQPDLVNGRMTTIDEAYDVIAGKERMLEERGIKPYGIDPVVQAGATIAKSTPGGLAAMSNKRGKSENDNLCYECEQVREQPEEWCRNFRFHGNAINTNRGGGYGRGGSTGRGYGHARGRGRGRGGYNGGCRGRGGQNYKRHDGGNGGNGGYAGYKRRGGYSHASNGRANGNRNANGSNA